MGAVLDFPIGHVRIPYSRHFTYPRLGAIPAFGKRASVGSTCVLSPSVGVTVAQSD
jgi:hypothetical protein